MTNSNTQELFIITIIETIKRIYASSNPIGDSGIIVLSPKDNKLNITHIYIGPLNSITAFTPKQFVSISHEPYDDGNTLAVVYSIPNNTPFPTSKTRHYQSLEFMASKELDVSRITCRNEQLVSLDIFEFISTGNFVAN